MILCPHTPDTPPYRGQRATIIQLSQLLLTNGVNTPLCLKRSTNDTAITPSTFRIRFGFCIYNIRRERERSRGEGERFNLGRCNLFDFQGIIQERGGRKVLFNIILNDHNTHVWIIELQKITLITSEVAKKKQFLKMYSPI